MSSRAEELPVIQFNRRIKIMLISKVLRSLEGNRLAFMCPGCKETHAIYHGEGVGARWGWNGNADKPTFTPSVLVRSGHYAPGYQDSCWCTWHRDHPDKSVRFSCKQCHSFIVDGNIQFLSDCSHELAGQTVPLSEFTEE